jgi:SH3 domain-containing YSC84-like protein 1
LPSLIPHCWEVGKPIPMTFQFAREKEMNMIARETFRIFHRWTPALLVMMVLMMLSILPAWGADKTKDEETIGNGTNVLTAMLSGGAVPADVVAKADCVVVIPNMKKGSFIVGGSGGRGPMSCRTGADFSRKWSPPAMYSTGGMSVGLQAGGSSSDFVILLMNKKAVDAFLKGKTKLGRDASVAAGPGATAASLGGDVLTYARTSGVFAGLSLGGASFEADNNANQRLYDKPVSPSQIVSGKVQATTAGQAFASLLDSKTGKHTM